MGHCFGFTNLCRVVPNSDQRNRCVCPYLTLMINYFSWTLFVQMFELITILPKNTPHIHVSHFVLTSFPDVLVTFVSDQVTCRPLQPMLSTGSEQQGQNIRVRPVFLTLTKILDLLVFFHRVCKNFSSSRHQLQYVKRRHQTSRKHTKSVFTARRR